MFIKVQDDASGEEVFLNLDHIKEICVGGRSPLTIEGVEYMIPTCFFRTEHFNKELEDVGFTITGELDDLILEIHQKNAEYSFWDGWEEKKGKYLKKENE